MVSSSKILSKTFGGNARVSRVFLEVLTTIALEGTRAILRDSEFNRYSPRFFKYTRIHLFLIPL